MLRRSTSQLCVWVQRCTCAFHGADRRSLMFESTECNNLTWNHRPYMDHARSNPQWASLVPTVFIRRFKSSTGRWPDPDHKDTHVLYLVLQAVRAYVGSTRRLRSTIPSCAIIWRCSCAPSEQKAIWISCRSSDTEHVRRVHRGPRCCMLVQGKTMFPAVSSSKNRKFTCLGCFGCES